MSPSSLARRRSLLEGGFPAPAGMKHQQDPKFPDAEEATMTGKRDHDDAHDEDATAEPVETPQPSPAPTGPGLGAAGVEVDLLEAKTEEEILRTLEKIAPTGAKERRDKEKKKAGVGGKHPQEKHTNREEARRKRVKAALLKQGMAEEGGKNIGGMKQDEALRKL